MAGSKMADITGLTSGEQKEAERAKEEAKAEEEEEEVRATRFEPLIPVVLNSLPHVSGRSHAMRIW